MRQALYFGHPVNTYNTNLEGRMIFAIKEFFPDWLIENPNQPIHEKNYQEWKARTGSGMNYYYQEVLPKCTMGVFLPFRDGSFGAGVFGEAKFIQDLGHPIYKINPRGNSIWLLDLSRVHVLSVEETRARIKLPY
jgi:hypothetical protein